MVIGERRSSYKEDDVVKVTFVRDDVLNDLWWYKINYILSFTELIYKMLRKVDTDQAFLHLVCDMWDFIIEKDKAIIYRHEGKKH